MPINQIVHVERATFKRDSIIKAQAIQFAGDLCEINSSHSTFIFKASGHQYIEGHHVIPMKKQSQFHQSLDVYANEVCLCSICHRLLHYGIDSEKAVLINRIYESRIDRLANSGIKLSRQEFTSMAN